jgi:Domain of unknown function (DUF4832)
MSARPLFLWSTVRLAVGLALACTALAGPAASAPALVTVRPADHGRALVNPGMGFVLHFYDNSLERYGSRLDPSDALEDWPGLSTVYFRLAWSHLEPEEGRFDWALVDGPAQRWIDRGKRIAFRFTASEGEPGVGTPAWVRAAGPNGYSFEGGTGVVPDAPGRPWEPDFDDPVFLAKLDRFVAAAAARYDGRLEVAFVDVGSFGIWGEGHTFWSTKRPYSAETVLRHVELWRKHFQKTLLAANDDFSDHGRGDGWIPRALELGLTLRDDSILVEPPPLAYKSATKAQRFWPTAPVILEGEHYGGSVERGAWGDGSLYLQAVEDYHASYASIHWWPREFLSANRGLVERMNRRLGYRLQLLEASWPEEVRAGEPWAFASRWRNAGVAPCLPGGSPAVTLKDARGGIVAVLVDPGLDVRTLPVGPPGGAPPVAVESTFRLPASVKPGTYDVFVSIGSATGMPAVALPHDGDDGQRRVRLGAVRVLQEGAPR